MWIVFAGIGAMLFAATLLALTLTGYANDSKTLFALIPAAVAIAISWWFVKRS